VDDAILNFLRRAGLIQPGQHPHFEPLAGGVSSDIWIVRSDDTSFCVKQALPRLRVTAEWLAPVARNTSEVAWLKAVSGFMRPAVPKVLAADPELGVFAMEYLPPELYEPWKAQLRRGIVDPETGALVGRRLVRVHKEFAMSENAAREFANDGTFYALRLEPYLAATARAHPALAPVLERLLHRTAKTKVTVIHGDVSPKNILIGPAGPVFIDAECATYGDPAFDLAFCLNHLLLKTLWVPSAAAQLLQTFKALSRAYLDGVNWELSRSIEQRTAHLLPALLLARIDGKSPVEYLTDESSKDTVRRVARALLIDPVDQLEKVAHAWERNSAAGAEARAFGPSTDASKHFPRIERVIGRRVWDSRGRPTVEAEIVLDNGVTGRAIAPVGASTGSHEAIDLRDGGSELDGLGVSRALANINSEIAGALQGMEIADQGAIDQRLIDLDGTPNKARLGANATVAVSMAALHAAAAASGVALWRYLANVHAEPILPMPMVQIFGGGAHAGFRLDIQDFLIIPVSANTFSDAMSMTARVYAAAGQIMRERGELHGVADEGGWWPAFASNSEALDTLVQAIRRAGLEPGQDVGIAIDVAASQLRTNGTYQLKAEGANLTTEQFIELLVGWCGRYPIISVEDPLAEDDHDGMRMFTARMGQKLQIVGDDYLVTSASRIASAASSGACNTALIKPNQVGTITETLAAIGAARAAGWESIISARSGETEDVSIAHLAVGWGVGQLKVGSFARSERMAKWNEVLRIEEAIGGCIDPNVFRRGSRTTRATPDDGRATPNDGRSTMDDRR
jgi:enolase